ncbi:MAG TPA: hypothetical protein VFF06_10065 [Polyangia bacterium]|nr:hypothetical protein [Polyangia bacterium]
MNGTDEDFEIALRRPYAPLVLVIALMTPLALWMLLHDRNHHKHLLPLSRFLESNPLVLYTLAIALLAFAAFLCLVIFCIARHARWSLRATDAGLHLPRSRTPFAGSELERVAWKDILIVRLNHGFDLIVETRARKWIIPAYWLRTRGQAQAAQSALDERLRREQQKIGAAKAR